MLAVKAMVEKYGPKKENLDPHNWMKHQKVRGFTEFIMHSDKDTDTSFDNKEMCEYTRK